jgi:hypothetical protein
VAVWAKDPQVGQPIVVAPPIDVIEFQGDGVPVPGVPDAHLTFRLLESFQDQSLLQPIRLCVTTIDQQLLNPSANCWIRGSASPSLPREVRRI